jgi:hypothetical protein
MMARVSKVLELSFGPPISKHTFDIGQPHPKLEELFSSMQALSISSYIQSLLAALDSPNWFIPTLQQHLQEA